VKTTLLIPTLNEIDGMRAIMPQIDRRWVDQILVVDAGSTDGTVEYVLEHGYELVRQQSRGLVGAYREALEVAVGDVIIMFTPDGNSLAELIPRLVEKMREGYDMVIVSRYRDGAKSFDDDPVTAFGNWMFTRLINLLFGAHYTDSLVGFRAWKKELYAKSIRRGDRDDFEPRSAIRCAKLKLKVGEIPGNEPKRIGGVRKMRPLVNGSKILLIIFREWIGLDR